MMHIIVFQAVQMAAEHFVTSYISHENAKATVQHVCRVVDIITTAVEVAAL